MKGEQKVGISVVQCDNYTKVQRKESNMYPRVKTRRVQKGVTDQIFVVAVIFLLRCGLLKKSTF